jgi:microcompartment protein CcmK/EutM
LQVGRVVGTLVATRKDEKLAGAKLLVVRTMDPSFKEEQGYVVAVDTVDAGVGDPVLLVAGSSARMAHGMKEAPVDSAIVGIVDQVALKGDPPIKPGRG